MHILWNYVCVCTYTKFQVSGVILMSFRRGNFTSPSPKQTPKKPTQMLTNMHKRKLYLCFVVNFSWKLPVKL